MRERFERDDFSISCVESVGRNIPTPPPPPFPVKEMVSRASALCASRGANSFQSCDVLLLHPRMRRSFLLCRRDRRSKPTSTTMKAGAWLVSRRGATFNSGYNNASFIEINIIENAPVTDTTAESFLTTFQFANIALKRIVFHFIDCRAYARPVTRREAFK